MPLYHLLYQHLRIAVEWYVSLAQNSGWKGGHFLKVVHWNKDRLGAIL